MAKKKKAGARLIGPGDLSQYPPETYERFNACAAALPRLPELARQHQLHVEGPALRQLADDMRSAGRELEQLAAALDGGVAQFGVDGPQYRKARRKLEALQIDGGWFCNRIRSLSRVAQFPLMSAPSTTLRTYANTLKQLSAIPEEMLATYSAPARDARRGRHGRLPDLALRSIAVEAERFRVPSMLLARMVVVTTAIVDPRTPGMWTPATTIPDGEQVDDFMDAAIRRWSRALDDARYELRQRRGKRRR